MRTRYFPDASTHTYIVRLFPDDGELCTPSFYFPRTGNGDECVISWGSRSEYAQPPSDVLRSLIEAAAPWYVVLDRLAEEYPQWQSYFDAAAAAERAALAGTPPHTSVS